MACADVGDREPDLRHLVGRAGERHRPGLRLDREVVRLVVGAGATEAVPADVAGDQMRMFATQLMGEQSGSFRCGPATGSG